MDKFEIEVEERLQDEVEDRMEQFIADVREELDDQMQRRREEPRDVAEVADQRCGAKALGAVRDLGIEVSTHLYPEVAAHLMRVTETAHWLEWQDWADPVLAEPFKLGNSQLVVPGKPGCGIGWDEDAVKRFRYGI